MCHFGFQSPTLRVRQLCYLMHVRPTAPERSTREGPACASWRHGLAAMAALPCRSWAPMFTSLSSRVRRNTWLIQRVFYVWLFPESWGWLRRRRFCIWRAAGGGRSALFGNIIWESGFPATALCVRRTVRTVKSDHNKVSHTHKNTNTRQAFCAMARYTL